MDEKSKPEPIIPAGEEGSKENPYIEEDRTLTIDKVVSNLVRGSENYGGAEVCFRWQGKVYGIKSNFEENSIEVRTVGGWELEAEEGEPVNPVILQAVEDYRQRPDKN